MLSALRICLCLVWMTIGLVAFSQTGIIPKPTSLQQLNSADSFVLSPQTRVITAQPALQPSVDFLNSYLQEKYGWQVSKSKKGKAPNTIQLALGNTGSATAGSYTLVAGKSDISITGLDAEGVFYGLQTLIQLLPVDTSVQSLAVPAVQISDAPRFAYRGMMLDVSRHFFSADFVKKYIDLLALHKMNRLHWHLTDDQGWRIEIKKYPKLTSVGGWRNGTVIGNYPGNGNDNLRYGGFYTQEEIKEIVRYAAKRYITIVPEIEMPGHASAAIAAYPYLSCFPEEASFINKFPSEKSKLGGKQVQETWGVHNDVYCAANDTVFSMMEAILTEVIGLFPSQYIHVGGDECPKDNWKRCGRCQQRMKELKLKDEHELQSYFIQRVEKFINSKGRVLIGWDEILEGGLAPNAVVMSWRGEDGGIEAAKQGHDVVMTPNGYVYFDHFQGKSSMEPMSIGGYLPLQKVYSYEPIPASLTADQARHIKGVQANLWTEYIGSTEKVEYMSMPRMAAIAEVAWSSSGKDWTDFSQRMEAQYQRYALWGVNASHSAYNVKQTIAIDGDASRATVSLNTDSFAPTIYYTLDGSEPSPKSSLYKKTFSLYRSATIKAASFQNGKQVGKTSIQQVVL